MTRRELLAGGTLALWAGAAEARQRPPRRLALLVGVCELAPREAAGMQLYGTRNDVARFRQLLLDRYAFDPKEILTVTGLQATKANILAAVERHLVAQAGPDDLVMFYFTGHGVLAPPRPGDDPSYRYKAFIPYDVQLAKTNPSAGPNPSSCLYNLELSERLVKLKARQCVTIFDACHSGVGARGRAKGKNFAGFSPPVAAGKQWKIAEASRLETVVLTACRADEVALEGPLLLAPDAADTATPETERPFRMSYLTCHLIETLRQDRAYQLTWEEAFKETRRRLAERLSRDGFVDANNLPTQNPEAGGRLAIPVFGLTAPPKGQPLSNAIAEVVRVEGKTVTLGLREGADIPAGGVLSALDDPKAQATVESASGTTARARLVSGTMRVGQRLLLAGRRFPSPKLRVLMTGKSLPASLKNRLGELTFLQIVSAESGADAVVTISEGARRELVWGSSRLPDVLGDDALILALTNLHALLRLMNLDNPDGKSRLEAKINGQPNLSLKEGETLALTARSRADGYLYVLDIDAAGSVTLLFPNQYAATNRVRANETYELPKPGFRLRAKPPLGAGIVKALVTDRPLSLAVLAKAEGKIAELGGAADVARDLLLQLHQELADGRGIGVEADDTLPVSGWAAATVYVKITPA